MIHTSSSDLFNYMAQLNYKTENSKALYIQMFHFLCYLCKPLASTYCMGAVFSYCRPGGVSLVLRAISAFFNSWGNKQHNLQCGCINQNEQHNVVLIIV